MFADAVPEQAALPERPGLAAELAVGGFPPGPGAWAWLEPSGPGRSGPGPSGDVALCAVADALWYPGSGLVTTAGGVPLFSPTAQMRDVARARRAKPSARRDRAALWLSPGGAKNYGHFLFDGLTGLAALDDAGLTARFPPVAPPLTAWQRGLLDAAGLDSAAARGGAIAIGQLVYTTAMNSYLNRAGALVPALAARFGQGQAGAGAVYLSRRGFSGRIVVNEAALEAALTQRGVRILRPEALPVAEQIAAAHGAEVLIGASGAALANALFLGRGGTVIELRPEPVAEPWMGLTTAALGLRHVVLPLAPVPAPPLAWLRQLPRKLTGRYHYCLRADIEAVLAVLG